MRPVRGSRTWCRLPCAHRRLRVVDVATPARGPATAIVSSTRSGWSTGTRSSSMPMDHGSPSPGSPARETSPPRFTSTPLAPAASNSSATMSAARPLPMAPGSRPTPAGSATVDRCSSMRTALMPGAAASRTSSSAAAGRAATVAKSASYPRARMDARTVGSKRPAVAVQASCIRWASWRRSADTGCGPRPAVAFSRLSSLPGRKRLHDCSSSSTRMIARSASSSADSRGAYTSTWQSVPMARKVRSLTGQLLLVVDCGLAAAPASRPASGPASRPGPASIRPWAWASRPGTAEVAGADVSVAATVASLSR